MRTTHFCFLLGLLSLLACKSTKPMPADPEPNVTAFSPSDLVEKYQQGEVERCQYEGRTIYRCGQNAPDAGHEIFDGQGRQIGVCYYSTNRVDPPCEGATGCETLYRAMPNIWGKPGVEFKNTDK